MEALVAFGLAGNVVQFVQFAGKVNLGNELYKDWKPLLLAGSEESRGKLDEAT